MVRAFFCILFQVFAVYAEPVIFTNSSLDSDERGKARSKRSGLNEEGMVRAMSDEEGRSGNAIADRIPDESVKIAGVPVLKLQLIYTGENPLYPGQEFYVGYLYTFNASIDLTEEQLPLLEIEGFKKIGDRQADQKQEGALSTTRVIQKLQAVQPGHFVVPASSAKGRAYESSPGGAKKYLQPELKAETSSLEIVVDPFPEKGKPASFNGSIGSFSVKSFLKTPSKVKVGDRLLVGLTVEGKGEMQTIKLPELCCQPGFSGFLSNTNFPPSFQENVGAKTFTFELSVDNPDISELPSIEWASFDPKEKKYMKSRTAPIPLQVGTMPSPPPPPSSYRQKEAQGVAAWEGNAKASFHLPPPPWEGLFVWGGLWLLYWMFVPKWRSEELEQEKVITSRKLFHKAGHTEGDEALKWLSAALTLRAQENPETATKSHALLEEIYEERFGKAGEAKAKPFLLKAKPIFEGGEGP
jgi:hypothetical protein